MRKFLFTLLLVATASTLAAQDYRYEVGPVVGVSGFLGDVNNSNMYRHPGIVAGGIFRYNINTRMALKANAVYARVGGNSKDIKNKFPHDQEYSFKSSIIDVGAQFEFNFWHFGVGPKYKNMKRIAPYLTAGVGMAGAITGGKFYVSPVIPLGAGVRFRVKDRLNLGFEFTMRKEFSDKFDGLSDLYSINHGMAKNTDWYSFAMFTITYEFSKRCTKCHYLE